jgi:O-antigen/teichoic acid export membrane protein
MSTSCSCSGLLPDGATPDVETGPETPATPSLRRTVVRGVGVVASGQLLTQILTFATYVALARLAAPHTFGTFAAASVLVTFSSLIVESGMSSALIQRRDRLEEAAATAFVATALGGAFFTVLSMAASPLIGWYFGSHQIGEIALASSGTHFITSLGVVPNALLQREFAFVRRLVVEPGAVVGLAVGSIGGLAAGWGGWGLLLGAYLSVTIRVLLLWALSRWRPQIGSASFAMWRDLARYGRHILGSEMLREGNRVAVTAVIGRFGGAAQLGQYNFGSRIATQTNALTTVTGASVLFPAFSRIAHEPVRFRAAFLRALRAVCFIAVPAGLIFLGIGEQFVVVLLGDRWRVAGHVLVALSGLGLGSALGSVGAEAFKAAGRPEFAARMQMVGAPGSVILIAALLPFGVAAAAAGLSIATILIGCYAVSAACGVLNVERRLVVREVWPAVVGGLMAAAAAGALDRFLLHATRHATAIGIAFVAIETLAAAAVYLLVLRVAAPGRAAEVFLSARDGLRPAEPAA